MLILTPPDADPLLLTGANDAQLFAYSICRFQTVSLSHPFSHFVISLVTFEFICYFLAHPKAVTHGYCCTLCIWSLVYCVFAEFDCFERYNHEDLPLIKYGLLMEHKCILLGVAHAVHCQ